MDLAFAIILGVFIIYACLSVDQKPPTNINGA